MIKFSKIKNSFITSLIIVATFVLSATYAIAAFDLLSWQYYRDLSVPQGSEFVKVTLPDTASRYANNFSDIRIITNENVEVPYFLTKNSVVRGGTISVRILDQTENSGMTSFIIDIGTEGAIRTGLTIESANSNFRRRVSVYSASSLLPISGFGWNLVTDKGFIYRLTDPYTSSVSGKYSIDFPANTSRYLKVVIDSGTEGAVNISNASVYGDTHIDVPSYQKEVIVSIFNNPTKKTSEITLDLGEAGHMTDAVTIYPTDTNYSRRIIIESTDNSEGPWRYVGESSISGISTQLFTGTSNKVTYSEQKSRYIRLSIVNDDNRPLNIGSKAKVEGPIISAIFETRSGESYKLYYGNPSARTSTYDIGRISSYIETNKLPLATAMTEKENPAYVAPTAPVIPFTEKYPLVLNTILVLIVLIVVVAIGWYLYMYTKKRGMGEFTGGNNIGKDGENKDK